MAIGLATGCLVYEVTLMELKVSIRALELRDRERSFCLDKGTKLERVTAAQGTKMENFYQPRVTLLPPDWPFLLSFLL